VHPALRPARPRLHDRSCDTRGVDTDATGVERSWRGGAWAVMDELVGWSADLGHTRDLAVRAFGVCALLQVLSVWAQAPGLFGPSGVLPGGASLLAIHGIGALATVGALGLITGWLAGPSAA